MNKQTSKVANQIGESDFYIAHFGDKRTRIYAGESYVSHMSGKEAKEATIFGSSVMASRNDVQGFNNIGKYMAKGMDKASNDERIAYATGEYSNMVKDIVEIPAYAAAVTAAIAKSRELARKANKEAKDSGKVWVKQPAITIKPVAPASYERVKAYDEPKRYIQAAQALVRSITEDTDNHTVCASDGSCSGLQHLGAMIADRKTAELVNLTNIGERKDIYMIVAQWVQDNVKTIEDVEELELVSKETRKRLSDDDREIIEALEIIAAGGVNRAVTKNPVMVLTYGSTTQTTLKTVKAELLKSGAVTMDSNGMLVALIIGMAVERGRVANAGNAMGAMAFLQDIVKATNANDKAARWTTGNGIVLHNVKRKSVKGNNTVYTPSGNVQVFPRTKSGELDKAGMLAAIAPNFVHSFDAKHLQMVVNECAIKGIQLITIHDSFNCTPANYVEMNEIIRRTFVELYKDSNHLKVMLEMNKEAINNPEVYAELESKLATVFVDDYDVNEVMGNEFSFG